jgi:chemotaxis protein MotA
MTTIGGLVFLLAMVFGGYIISGGKFDIILHSLPYEMMMIGGAAVGSFVMSNSMHDIKHVLGGFGKIVKGCRFHKHEYVELLTLLYFFVRLAQSKGAMALEPHIEKPEESPAFQKFPKIAKDKVATVMICDYLRMVGMNADDPRTPCRPSPMRCRRSASSPRCSASSRPWPRSTSRRRCSAA